VLLLVHLAPAGRFAFVELRTDELATTAMTLDKTELCGRQMNIGRPKGYMPGSSSGSGVFSTTFDSTAVLSCYLSSGLPVSLPTQSSTFCHAVVVV